MTRLIAASTTHHLPAPAAGAGAAHEEIPPTPMPRISRLLTTGAVVMGVFLGGFGTWSAFAPLESAAMAPGVVEVESARKVVQHLECGIISQILVHDGDHVSEGQALVRLDDTKARTSYASVEGQVFDLMARQARLLAERDGKDTIMFPDELAARAAQDSQIGQVVSGQRSILAARRKLLDSKVSAIREKIQQTNEEIRGLHAQDNAVAQKLEFTRAEIEGARKLLDQGLERKPHLLQLQRDQAETEGSRGQIAAQIARAQQTIAESEVNILTLRNDSANEVAQQLRETEGKLHELQEQLRAAADVLSRIEVRAPEAGVVTDLRVHTPGGVVKPGDALLDLIPGADKLIIKARVRPEDTDLVRPGLTAYVRLLPYKQRRTPPIEGKVTYVSADRHVDERPEPGQPAGQSYFQAKIEVSKAALDDLPGVEMIPGMPAEVMIKTGKSTVALYALSPLLDSFDHAFREK
ncbi:MAG TPA: HlyD family type I secretion periplasmic adaptor subunit [Stellaceae bacterium]|nr:HlyD family type I secretion periplasmic adaptor subunit [Stellaceae bacterium]